MDRRRERDGRQNEIMLAMTLTVVHWQLAISPVLIGDCHKVDKTVTSCLATVTL